MTSRHEPIDGEIVAVRTVGTNLPAVASEGLAEVSDRMHGVAEVVRTAPVVVAAVPAIARVAASMAWRATTWSVSTSVTTVSNAGGRAMRGESAGMVAAGAVADFRTLAWRALGMNESTDRRGVPAELAPSANATETELHVRGHNLLRRSNEVGVTDDTHPAFARILTEITPDEARILRFLYMNGPQPAIDVRTNRPLGIGSQLVSGGLNMIAELAGCQNVERIHPYLTNLFRLGLLEFSKEKVSNPQRYQLIEAQPVVIEAMKQAGRWPRTVQRSIHLNSFGEEFCRVCLPVEGAPGSARQRTLAPNEPIL